MSLSPELDRIFRAEADKLILAMWEAGEAIEEFGAMTVVALNLEINPPPRPWWRRVLRGCRQD